MKKLPFNVKRYSDPNRPALTHVVRGKVNDKWKRKFFTSEAAAKTYAHLRNTEMIKYGSEAMEFSISPLRVMAQECQAQLASWKKNLRDATDFLLRHLVETEKSCTIEELFAEAIRAKRLSGLSRVYIRGLEGTGAKFSALFPGKLISEFTARDINQYLESLTSYSPRSRNTVRGWLSSVFDFGKENGFCAKNVVRKSVFSKAVPPPVGIVDVDGLARVLAAADPRIVPGLAIGAFAGLRTEEIALLDWLHVKLESGFIEVPAINAKSDVRRCVRILPNLDAWLRPLVQASGPVTPGGKWLFFKLRALARDRAGVEAWPRNALRHSFASHHIAHFNNAAVLAFQMGHRNERLIYEHYLAVVTPSEAARYWQITPTSAPGAAAAFFKVFPADQAYAAKISTFAELFKVSQQSVYEWLKRPGNPGRDEHGGFDVAAWSEFTATFSYVSPPKIPKHTRSFFVADSPSALKKNRVYFKAKADGQKYCDERNANLQSQTVHSAPAPANVVFPFAAHAA